jgi:hypothetical protein
MNKTVIYKLKERKRIMFGKNRSPESESKKKESPEIKLSSASLGRSLTPEETSSLQEVAERSSYFFEYAPQAVAAELSGEQIKDIRQSLTSVQQKIFDEFQRHHAIDKKDPRPQHHKLAPIIIEQEFPDGRRSPDIYVVIKAIIDSQSKSE